MTSKSLQPIVCCLGEDVGGNPTQFVLEKAFAEQSLTDWKLFTAEVATEQVDEALKACELLGIEGVMLLTDTLRSRVVHAPESVESRVIAEWCGRASLLRRYKADKLAAEIPTSAEATAVPPSPRWEATYSVGSAILQTLLPKDLSAQVELHCLVLGDGPTARGTIAALASHSSSQIWWRIGENDNPLEDRCGPDLRATLDLVIQAERLKISSELPGETDSGYDTIVLSDERYARELEKWIAREQSPSTRRMVDARCDVFSLSLQKLACIEAIPTIRQTDWLGKMLEEDFLRLTGVAPNSVIVRDALDEYLEL